MACGESVSFSSPDSDIIFPIIAEGEYMYDLGSTFPSDHANPNIMRENIALAVLAQSLFQTTPENLVPNTTPHVGIGNDEYTLERVCPTTQPQSAIFFRIHNETNGTQYFQVLLDDKPLSDFGRLPYTIRDVTHNNFFSSP